MNDTSSRPQSVRLLTPVSGDLISLTAVATAISISIARFFDTHTVAGGSAERWLFLIFLAGLAFRNIPQVLSGGTVGDAVPQSKRLEQQYVISVLLFLVIATVLSLDTFLDPYLRYAVGPAGLLFAWLTGRKFSLSLENSAEQFRLDIVPALSVLLIGVALLASTTEWRLPVLFILLIPDVGLAIWRYSRLEKRMRLPGGEVSVRMRKAANLAMLVRFVVGTFLVALLVGFRPGLIAVPLVATVFIDRLILQMSVVADTSKDAGLH